jgi:hypothetical protein
MPRRDCRARRHPLPAAIEIRAGSCIDAARAGRDERPRAATLAKKRLQAGADIGIL